MGRLDGRAALVTGGGAIVVSEGASYVGGWVIYATSGPADVVV